MIIPIGLLQPTPRHVKLRCLVTVNGAMACPVGPSPPACFPAEDGLIRQMSLADAFDPEGRATATDCGSCREGLQSGETMPKAAYR